MDGLSQCNKVPLVMLESPFQTFVPVPAALLPMHLLSIALGKDKMNAWAVLSMGETQEFQIPTGSDLLLRPFDE